MNNNQNFEQDYASEVALLRSIRVRSVDVPAFKYYHLMNKGSKRQGLFTAKNIGYIFAFPGLAVAAFVFFFNISQQPTTQELAMLEESNARIINQIDALDDISQ